MKRRRYVGQENSRRVLQLRSEDPSIGGDALDDDIQIMRRDTHTICYCLWSMIVEVHLHHTII